MKLIERSVAELRKDNPQHPWLLKETSRYFEGEPDRDQLTAIFEGIASSEQVLGDGRICLVLGLGNQTRKAYWYLKELPGIKLHWDGPCLPILAYPISLIAASHMGLIQIQDIRQLVEAMSILSNHAMCELYSCSANLLPKIRDHVRRRKWRSQMGPIIGSDPSYYFFGVDGDYQGDTGAIAWCSFGPNCPIGYLPTEGSGT